MALNWTMLNANRSPVPLPNEMTITTVDSGVDLSLTIPDATPSSSSTAGGSGGVKKLRSTGKVYLTDQRVLHIHNGSNSPFESLSVPLHSILLTRFEQPTFGANYLTFEVKPSPDGGLTDGTKVEVRFKDRAMFEFSIYMKRQITEDEEGLRDTVSMIGGIPVENPPSYD
ncbi:hypothetical protein BDZ97DRAFT_1803277 [Flammula alnicola]|nr:hypothetical protein BDZ97DRAFT_1803277 [Flammula alnicola]